ncbi:MAG: acyl-CoA dehydrogenase family protein [Nitriliruptoraceae bacterium]
MSVTYTLSDEQRQLAEMARDLFAERATSARVRAVMLGEDGAGFDDALWSELAQYGLLGLTIPEAHGGAGATFAELAIVLEEAGRRLAPVPLLSSAVLGTEALLGAGTDEQHARLLPEVAAGSVRLALAHLDTGGDLWSPPGVHATRVGDGWTLDGTAAYVIDGASATHLVVAAQDGEGLALFVVPADADGVTRTPVDVLDLTRPLADVEFAGVEVAAADHLDGGDPMVALHRALTAGVVALAVEQVGIIDHTLAACTAYARDRIQFGRAIGSFQAIKHRLADLLVEAESARSAALHAARTLAADEDRQEIAIAAALAKAYCSEVADRAAADGIQIFGGIGFTWEHDQHLYLKRARAAKLLLGDPKHHRGILAELLEV